jgi:hypothetical protein
MRQLIQAVTELYLLYRQLVGIGANLENIIVFSIYDCLSRHVIAKKVNFGPE